MRRALASNASFPFARLEPLVKRAALALAVLFLSVPALAQARTRAEVARRVLPSSVRIQVLVGGEVRRSATGVIVRAEGAPGAKAARSVVLTNAHVVDPAGLEDVRYRLIVEKKGRVERQMPARLVALGKVPEMDLALVEVDEQLAQAVPLASEASVDVGDEVVVVGAPYGRALSVSGGMLSQIESEDDAPNTPVRFRNMKTDAPIGYGSSGGGVFTVPGGELVGLVEGYRTARVAINDKMAFDVPMPGETFVAPVTKLRRFIADHLDRPTQTAAAEVAPAAEPAR